MAEAPERDTGVMNPSLAKLVAHARAQVAPPVSVTFESVRTQADKRRNVRWAAGAAAVLAAAAALLWIGRARDPVSVAHTPSVAQSMPAASAGAPSDPAGPEASVASVAPTAPDGDVIVALHGGGSVRGASGAVVRAPDDGGPVQLESGSFVIETGSATAELWVHERVLEVAADAVVLLDVSVQTQRFEVRSGDAQWRAGDADPDAAPDADGPGAGRLSAEALVRRAEAQMKAANRTAATRTLTTLVRRYPRSGAAKAAILDLARLRKAAGQKAHARCAYTLFLERWPKAADAAAVRRARDRLPGHGKCRGLDPHAG